MAMCWLCASRLLIVCVGGVGGVGVWEVVGGGVGGWWVEGGWRVVAEGSGGGRWKGIGKVLRLEPRHGVAGAEIVGSYEHGWGADRLCPAGGN